MIFTDYLKSCQIWSTVSQSLITITMKNTFTFTSKTGNTKIQGLSRIKKKNFFLRTFKDQHENEIFSKDFQGC